MNELPNFSSFRAAKVERSPGKVIAFLLCDDFSFTDLILAVDLLETANKFAGCNLFQTQIISGSGDEITHEPGIVIKPDDRFSSAIKADTLVVLGDTKATSPSNCELLAALKVKAARVTKIGAIGNGVFSLATAGILNGRRCSVSYKLALAFSEQFPDVEASSSLFTIDGRIFTCVGGSTTLDLMLTLFVSDIGALLLNDLTQHFQIERIRDQHNEQVAVSYGAKTIRSRIVREAIKMFEKRIDCQITVREIACEFGISIRQLERAFRKNLDRSPAEYFKLERMKRTRQLVQDSKLTLIEICQICGFQSTSGFMRCYRRSFGITPSEDRAFSRMEL